MDELGTLVGQLRARGVRVWVEGDEIHYRGPSHSENARILSQLSNQKAELIRLLKLESSIAQRKHPLSLSQRLWYRPHDTGMLAVEFLRTPTTLLLDGPVNEALLRQAVQSVIRRHPILRTKYGFDGVQAYQTEREPDEGGENAFRLVNLSTVPEEIHERAIWTILKEAYDQAPDYEAGRPLATWLFKLDLDRHLFAMIIDHIALDNQSMRLIIRDLFNRYHELVERGAESTDPNPPPYSDHVHASLTRQSAEHTTANLRRWREELDGVEPVDIRDPAKAPYPDLASRTFLPMHFPTELRERAFSFTRDNRLSISMLLTATFGLLLGRWAQTDRPLCTYVVDDRSPRLAETAGSFVRGAPYYLDLRGDPTGRELFERSRRACLNALDPERAINGNEFPNLSRVIINLQAPPPDVDGVIGVPELSSRDTLRPGGLSLATWRPRVRFQEAMSLDMQIYMNVNPKRLDGHIICATERLDTELAEWFARSASGVLQSLIIRSESPVSIFDELKIPDVQRARIESPPRC